MHAQRLLPTVLHSSITYSHAMPLGAWSGSAFCVRCDQLSISVFCVRTVFMNRIVSGFTRLIWLSHFWLNVPGLLALLPGWMTRTLRTWPPVLVNFRPSRCLPVGTS